MKTLKLDLDQLAGQYGLLYITAHIEDNRLIFEGEPLAVRQRRPAPIHARTPSGDSGPVGPGVPGPGVSAREGFQCACGRDDHEKAWKDEA